MPVTDLTTYLYSLGGLFNGTLPKTHPFYNNVYVTAISNEAERKINFNVHFDQAKKHVKINNITPGEFFEGYGIPLNKFSDWSSTGKIIAYELPETGIPFMITSMLNACAFVIAKPAGTKSLYACHIQPGDRNSPTCGTNLIKYISDPKSNIRFIKKSVNGDETGEGFDYYDIVALIASDIPHGIGSNIPTISYHDDQGKNATVIGYYDDDWHFAYQIHKKASPDSFSNVVVDAGKLY